MKRLRIKLDKQNIAFSSVTVGDDPELIMGVMGCDITHNAEGETIVILKLIAMDVDLIIAEAKQDE